MVEAGKDFSFIPADIRYFFVNFAARKGLQLFPRWCLRLWRNW